MAHEVTKPRVHACDKYFSATLTLTLAHVQLCIHLHSSLFVGMPVCVYRPTTFGILSDVHDDSDTVISVSVCLSVCDRLSA